MVRCSSRIKALEAKRAHCHSNDKHHTLLLEKKSKKRKNNDCMDQPVVENNVPSAIPQVGLSQNPLQQDVRITETLRKFNTHYLQLVQEEEIRCKKGAKDDRKTKKKVDDHKTKKKVTTYKESEKDGKKGGSKRSRADLKAMSKMILAKEILIPEKRIGSIPGINVGHQFFSRVEMVVLGLHKHWLNGIDYAGENEKKKKEFKGYKLPLAVAIVLSGQYEDDQDNSEDVLYTGQGGNDLLGNKHQIKDQVMQRGNLGLKNCKDQSVPVRVIRGHQNQNSYVGKVYTYDGLYKVADYWAEKGKSGFTVFKFRLKRMEGQPVLTTNQVHFTGSSIPKSISEIQEIQGLVCVDISGGKERYPIPATNLVDAAAAPTDFEYSRSIKCAKGLRLPSASPGCKCRGSCRDPRICSCAKLNGSDFPYVQKDGGRLIEPKAVVFECGPNCGCGPDCVNRISQKELRYRLEVFRTPNKGWGVRSWEYIQSGATICEYIGLLKKTDQIDPAAENNYVFDIDCLQTMKGLDGRERRVGEVPLPAHWHKDAEKTSSSDCGPEFCIDAGSLGNVARFINHSCQPNLFVQCVLSTHHDISLARVVLMAADNIPPLQELTYDYGYVMDSVMDRDGKVKQMPCYCGASDCRKRLY